MTGTECYRAALALLAETTDSAGYYETFALYGVNQLLANCFRENNALRERAGQEPFAKPPRIEALDAALPVDEAMAAECFPYGLAALLVCEDDKDKFNWCAAEFAARLARHCPAAFLPVEEMY
ncbi:hypothetical protein LI291_07040 [Intestinibacillus massiliensis]|uniref:hypothetical protein n=1 Tax=Intestinibacillus massiliensis TaxID=1871029 RepID=UPI000B356042|nr:hypothetical protein [Intestinibacillus massiliensis]MCB6365927.1 hypothetical protein [Intestinibacillus massiliensis]